MLKRAAGPWQWIAGALRQIAGFDLVQLVAEFRAMRASVLALWRKSQGSGSADAQAIEEIARFNEGIGPMARSGICPALIGIAH